MIQLEPNSARMKTRRRIVSSQVDWLMRSGRVNSGNTSPNSRELLDALHRAAAGDQQRWGHLLVEHRDRLRKLISFRMSPVLTSRLDPSDVIQETFVEASERLKEFLDNPRMPFFLWLRFLTQQKLATLHRHHLGRAKRNVNREVSMDGHGNSDDTSGAIAAYLASQWSGPSHAAMRHERQALLHQALEQMDPTDREILALRHFEGLSNSEAALLLNLKISAASKRYIRALEKLRQILSHVTDSSSKA